MRTAHGPYAAWASWLDAFGRGEDLPAAHLTAIDESLGPQMVARLLDRLAAAFRERTGRWADALRRHIDATPITSPTQLAGILVSARGRLRPLHALAADPRLPAQVRDELASALTDMTEQAQQSLERSVRRAPRGAEQLLAVVRENRLTTAAPPRPAQWAGTPGTPGTPPPPVGRRVIL